MPLIVVLVYRVSAWLVCCFVGGAAGGAADVYQDSDPDGLLPCTLLPAQQDHQGG